MEKRKLYTNASEDLVVIKARVRAEAPVEYLNTLEKDHARKLLGQIFASLHKKFPCWKNVQCILQELDYSDFKTQLVLSDKITADILDTAKITFFRTLQQEFGLLKKEERYLSMPVEIGAEPSYFLSSIETGDDFMNAFSIPEKMQVFKSAKDPYLEIHLQSKVFAVLPGSWLRQLLNDSKWNKRVHFLAKQHKPLADFVFACKSSKRKINVGCKLKRFYS